MLWFLTGFGLVGDVAFSGWPLGLSGIRWAAMGRVLHPGWIFPSAYTEIQDIPVGFRTHGDFAVWGIPVRDMRG